MAKMSQKTLTEMMRLAEQFGIYESAFESGPLVSPTEMRRYLFARDFSNDTLDDFEQRGWNFDTILRAISSGSFFGSQFLARSMATSAGVSQEVVAEDLLLKLANAFCIKD